MENKIREVHKLGKYLKKGEFENLFNMVGVLNQSDPKLSYLKNSEAIYKQRYKETKNLDYLYDVLISQILQKKIDNALLTVKSILNFDKSNGNTYLTKAIINTYLLRPIEAKEALYKSKNHNKSSESEEILDTLEIVINILNLKFFSAYKTLS